MDIQAISQVFLRANTQHLPVLRTLGDHPKDFTVTTGYDIVAVTTGETLGQLEMRHVKFGAALNVGQSFFDVADVDGDVFDIYEIMYDSGTNNPCPVFEKTMDRYLGCPEIWYVPSDDVLDHAWGRKALHILAQHADCSLGFIVVGVSDLMVPASDQAHALAIARVAALQRMGFVHCENTPFLFLNTELRLKPFEEKDLAAELSQELIDV